MRVGVLAFHLRQHGGVTAWAQDLGILHFPVESATKRTSCRRTVYFQFPAGKFHNGPAVVKSVHTLGLAAHIGDIGILKVLIFAGVDECWSDHFSTRNNIL